VSLWWYSVLTCRYHRHRLDQSRLLTTFERLLFHQRHNLNFQQPTCFCQKMTLCGRGNIQSRQTKVDSLVSILRCFQSTIFLLADCALLPSNSGVPRSRLTYYRFMKIKRTAEEVEPYYAGIKSSLTQEVRNVAVKIMVMLECCIDCLWKWIF
jgi:hypothetical protein